MTFCVMPLPVISQIFLTVASPWATREGTTDVVRQVRSYMTISLLTTVETPPAHQARVFWRA